MERDQDGMISYNTKVSKIPDCLIKNFIYIKCNFKTCNLFLFILTLKLIQVYREYLYFYSLSVCTENNKTMYHVG